MTVICLHPAMLGAFPFGSGEKPGVNELKQGDAAASFGDAVRAEKYYIRAEELSRDDLLQWSECVFRLGTLYLQKNDIESARKLLEEFRKRNPAGSAGTLPGEIMAAENNFTEAYAYFQSLIKRNDIASDKAKFCCGEMLMKQHKYQEAYDIFASLRGSRTALISRRAEYAMIMTLIYLGKTSEARSALDKIPENGSDSNYSKLRFFCAVKEGDLDYFRKNWHNKTEYSHADAFLSSVAELAAELAVKKGDFALSSKLYEDACRFALSQEKRREIISKLFSSCALHDIEAASEVAERYSKLFPDATDRVLLLMQSGRLLASGGNPVKAVKFYSKVAEDKENLLVERHAAALEGASAAEQGGLYEEAERFYQLLISLGKTSNRKDDAELRYAEYLLRRKKYAHADVMLREIAGREIMTPAGEHAAHLLLQSRSLQGKLSMSELPLAEQLGRSKNSNYAEFASFIEAEIFRLSGKGSPRKKYLDFITRYPASKFVPQAHFQAARLAGRSGDYAVAAREFTEFAEKYPEHQNAGAACFLSIDSYCRAGQTSEAEKELQKLLSGSRYPEACLSGILKLGEHLMLNNEAQKALETVQNSVSGGKWKLFSGRADVLFLEARILNSLKRYSHALAKLDKLTVETPESPEYCEANFLAGNIRSDIFNDFTAAEKNFRNAYLRSSAGVFKHASQGRLADCLYAMYLQTNEVKLLESADELYREIAENASHPDMRLQASYKSGLCREVSGDSEKALEDYGETLYSALALKNSGITPHQSWCARAACSAIELALNDDSEEDTVKAQQLLSVYRRLGFKDSGRDFKMLRHKIRERQKFLNRGVKP